MCDKIDRIVCRNHARARYTVGIYEFKKPPYGKKRRIERGLYQSATGTVINADVNGALNHLRKVSGDSVIPQIISSGRVNRPVRIRLAFEGPDLELSDRHPSYVLN